MSPNQHHQRGTSLVELLVSTLFLSILTAISYSFARAALMTTRVQAVKSDAQEATVMALDVMARELRMAGFSGAGSQLSPLRSAAADRVEVAADLNGDGDTDDSNERIAYSYDDAAHQLRRATGGASPQPFVRNVAPMGFHLTYFDAAGTEIASSSTGMTPADLDRVRRIDVALQVEFTNPDPNALAPLRSSVSSSICLRNE
jgi:Tfp pilus assembly protein PilW